MKRCHSRDRGVEQEREDEGRRDGILAYGKVKEECGTVDMEGGQSVSGTVGQSTSPGRYGGLVSCSMTETSYDMS